MFTGIHDADIMHNSALVNLNMVEACKKRNISRVFYSSSACMYPEHNQLDPDNPKTAEDSAYPADPDSEYGWEKLFSERGSEIAAVIIEPVAGNMGCIPPDPEWLETIRTQTQDHGALFICDEVMTGFRVAWGGAQARFDIQPDLTCLGKII